MRVSGGFRASRAAFMVCPAVCGSVGRSLQVEGCSWWFRVRDEERQESVLRVQLAEWVQQIGMHVHPCMQHQGGIRARARHGPPCHEARR